MPLMLPALLFTAGCGEQRPDDVPVVVSAIAGVEPNAAKLPNTLPDPTRLPLDYPQRVLLGATAQGLVQFDGQGGIESGIAERWIVSDTGRSYIFRLRAAKWPDGTPVTAKQVVTSLRSAIAAEARFPFAPFIAVIDEVVEMTPQVVEVRLKQPRPDLLKLFAQPEFAILRRPDLVGGGPFRVDPNVRNVTVLRPIRWDDERDAEVSSDEAADQINLISERAAMALARFAAGQSDLVIGGNLDNWPLVAIAGINKDNLRIDPAIGLFGFTVERQQGFTAEARYREALAMALDRAAITAQFRPDWPVTETLLPSQLDSSTSPALPSWSGLSLEDRIALARTRVNDWKQAHGGSTPIVQIAMPRTPGASALWVKVAQNFYAIGVKPERVGMDDEADLKLVDQVAPYDSGRWYLVTACQKCPAPFAEKIAIARDAATLGERAQRIAEADLAMAQAQLFIPIAQPLRWSVAALRLREFTPNSRSWHPLTHLRSQKD